MLQFRVLWVFSRPKLDVACRTRWLPILIDADPGQRSHLADRPGHWQSQEHLAGCVSATHRRLVAPGLFAVG